MAISGDKQSSAVFSSQYKIHTELSQYKCTFYVTISKGLIACTYQEQLF